MQSNNAAIIYEVNLTIEHATFKEHHAWLVDHFHQMVIKNNFIQLNLFFVKNINPIDDNHLRYQSVVAQYVVPNYKILEDYFEKQAKKMRNEVSEKLGYHYTVSRRVLQRIETFN